MKRGGDMKYGADMKHSQTRDGAALFDAIVAASLVMLTMAVATPMIVRSARIWKQTRNFQIACDELSGKMDLLVALPSDQRAKAIEQLSVQPSLLQMLPNAEIDGRLIENEDDTRLQLSINWERVGNPPPVTLVAWVKPIGGPIEPTQTTTQNPDTSTEDVSNDSLESQSDDAQQQEDSEDA